jgi:hypothetical protein
LSLVAEQAFKPNAVKFLDSFFFWQDHTLKLIRLRLVACSVRKFTPDFSIEVHSF